MKKLTKDYRESLLESLKDPAEAAEYLNAALEEGDSQVLMVALRDVVDAQQDISRLAKTVRLNRESVYRTLSKGNPRLASLESLLDALGLRLKVEPKRSAA
jgi:probable addiction module antidote protein